MNELLVVDCEIRDGVSSRLEQDDAQPPVLADYLPLDQETIDLLKPLDFAAPQSDSMTRLAG